MNKTQLYHDRLKLLVIFVEQEISISISVIDFIAWTKLFSEPTPQIKLYLFFLAMDLREKTPSPVFRQKASWIWFKRKVCLLAARYFQVTTIEILGFKLSVLLL